MVATTNTPSGCRRLTAKPCFINRGTLINSNKILIVGPSWVGDMVMAQTLFTSLKERNPACSIDVLAPAWSRPLLERMPEVNSAIAMSVGHGELALPKRWALAQQLRQHHYDAAYVLPNSLKSALIPAFAGIPLRVGWRGEMRFGLLNDIRLLDKERYPLMIERFIALAYDEGKTLPADLPRPHLEVDESGLSALRDKFDLDLARPVLALCPGAEFGPAKRWPEGHYQQVAQTMLDRGWQVWLMGSASDAVVGDSIASAISGDNAAFIRNLAGQTELSEAIDLLSMATAVVSNDSGLMHIAAALARPLVVVYGSTSPGFTPPLGDCVEVLSIAVDCGPCFQRECPRGDIKCLVELEPQRVIAALGRLVDSAASDTAGPDALAKV
ncbi:MAG: lipopolysaccharide heptosyltransferase II [Gammaproteobacteria bacterium]|nr:lipopolysaccharide heptosyltransferase II [Gammaproteobacteria bacterium]MBQ0841201.1 lipopolysaccharide heptosyltransferase II [Gammaproteobacteria bacterium]